MQEISIIELNELKEKGKNFVVLYYHKGSIISELACFNLEKINTELNLRIYKLQLINDIFNEPLPIISVFNNGILKSRLYGFSNLSRTKEYLKKEFII